MNIRLVLMVTLLPTVLVMQAFQKCLQQLLTWTDEVPDDRDELPTAQVFNDDWGTHDDDGGFGPTDGEDPHAAQYEVPATDHDYVLVGGEQLLKAMHSVPPAEDSLDDDQPPEFEWLVTDEREEENKNTLVEEFERLTNLTP